MSTSKWFIDSTAQQLFGQLLAEPGANIVIPDGYTDVLSGFNGKKIKSVVFPDSVVRVGRETFNGPTNWPDLVQPPINVSISADADYNRAYPYYSTFPFGSLIDHRGVNDQPLKISLDTSIINEGVAAGSVVLNLSTADPDPGDTTHTYSLVQGTGDADNASFAIKGSQLIVVDHPDFETKSSYSIRLETKDSGGLHQAMPFTIKVNDLNDSPSNISLSSLSFDENIATGSIVSSLSTSDQDSGDTHTYSLVSGIGDADNTSFAIKGSQLIVVDQPDFETKSTYSIRLKTQDTAGLNYEKAFTIKVNDSNDAPSNISLSSLAFDENIANGSVVANLSTSDPDSGDTHTYSLVSGAGDHDNNTFFINYRQLTISDQPDFETKPSYSIRLQSKDSGGLVFEKSFALKVNDLVGSTSSNLGLVPVGDPPNLSEATLRGRDITLKFDKILSNTPPSSNKFTLNQGNRKYQIIDAKIMPSDGIVTLSAEKELDPTVALTLDYTDFAGDQIQGVVESSTGVDLESFTGFTLNNQSSQENSLSIEDGEIEGNQITLFLSDPISNSLPSKRRFKVKSANKKQKILDLSTEPDEGIIVLTTKNILELRDSVFVSYRDLAGDQSNNIIEDLAGNDMATINDFEIISGANDAIAPRFASATLDENTLTVEFDSIIRNAKISKNRFKVKVDGKRVKVLSATVEKDDSYVELKLKPKNLRKIDINSSVTLSYSDPKGDQNGNVVEDIFGNDLESFGGYSVEIVKI